ncbi:MAG TPA: hypothetical protein VGD54_01455 [Steroidobacteraceae bacterium]
MEARELSEAKVTPIQLSLRIRHPAIDPAEISKTLGLVPEHCFKAGDSRGPRAAGHHTQTYWLAPVPSESWPDPIEPTFLAEIAAKRLDRSVALSSEDWREAAQDLRARSVEVVLLHFLKRLSARHSFLQQLQSEAGDVSLILLIEHESTADFTLPLSVARLLVQLGISIEFRFT